MIDVSGSFVLGLLDGWTIGPLSLGPWSTIVGTGLVGGYTTFSTASVETVRLLHERCWWAGLTNAYAVITLGVLAAPLGITVGAL